MSVKLNARKPVDGKREASSKDTHIHIHVSLLERRERDEDISLQV